MHKAPATVARVVSILVALGTAGCIKQTAASSGELVGQYAVRGQLVENTCGQAALPAKNPLSYLAELHDNAGSATWQPQKASSASGSFGSAGDFHFEAQQTQDMGTSVQLRQDVQPGDFLTPGADPDLIKRHCILVTIDTLSGVVHRRLPKPTQDGGDNPSDAAVASSDAGTTSSSADLTGDETVQVMAATGADCTAALAIQGGPYTILPCGLHYKLEGTLQPPP